MSKAISIIGKGNLSLISFILTFSVFTIEPVFSRKIWKKSDMDVNFDQKAGIITIKFLIYDYFVTNDEHGFLESCAFSFLDDTCKYYFFLMTYDTSNQKGVDRVPINLYKKKPGEQIQILHNSGSIFNWPDGLVNFKLEVEVKSERYQVYQTRSMSTSKRAYLEVKWFYMTGSRKLVKSIKAEGRWHVNDGTGGKTFFEVYKPNILNSNSTSLKNGPSVLESEIRDNVKVSQVADAIIVSGAEPGANIKVYTVLGEEVKSAVANDDGVSIKLPNNHIYIVNTGQARYKVAL